MTDLITRIEQADGPSAPLFIAAWNVLQSSDTASADWDRYAGIRVTVDEADVHRWIAFRKCLDAEAWTSALRLIVPQGWVIERYELDAVARHRWVLCSADASAEGRHDSDMDLALLAAILRAERKDDHGTDA